jgi:hypothetical protein
VKTLQDRPILLPVRTTTLRFLVMRPAPSALVVLERADELDLPRIDL